MALHKALPSVSVVATLSLDGAILPAPLTPAACALLEKVRRGADVYAFEPQSFRSASLRPPAGLRPDRPVLGLPFHLFFAGSEDLSCDLGGGDLLSCGAQPLKVAFVGVLPVASQAPWRGLPGLEVLEVGSRRTIDVLKFLRSEFQVGRVVLEGGGPVCAELLQSGWVGELHLVLSPRIAGSGGGERLVGGLKEFLPRSIEASLVGLEHIGEECFASFELSRAAGLGESFLEKVDGASFEA